jgi:hypothetical protein
MTGCLPSPAVVPEVTFEPSTVSVIGSVVPIGGDTLEFDLGAGQSFTYHPAEALSDIVPTAQDMLLAGQREGGGQWAMVVRHDSAGGICYRVRAPAFVRDRRVVFNNGLSLAMAPDFDPASAGSDGVWANDQAGFCIDMSGRVVSYQ